MCMGPSITHHESSEGQEDHAQHPVERFAGWHLGNDEEAPMDWEEILD